MAAEAEQPVVQPDDPTGRNRRESFLTTMMTLNPAMQTEEVTHSDFETPPSRQTDSTGQSSLGDEMAVVDPRAALISTALMGVSLYQSKLFWCCLATSVLIVFLVILIFLVYVFSHKSKPVKATISPDPDTFNVTVDTSPANWSDYMFDNATGRTEHEFALNLDFD